jgi:uncharacterized protein HemX
MSCIRAAWAKLSLWGKLAIISLSGMAVLLSYYFFKSKRLDRAAATQQQRIIAAKAEATVAYLEGQKDRNKERLAQIPEEEAALEEKLKTAKKQAEEAQARVAGMTDEAIAARFKELGY